MSPETNIDLNKFIVLGPEAQREQRFENFLKRFTHTRICVQAQRNDKTKTVAFYIAVYGIDVATNEEHYFNVPAFPPKAGQSIIDMVLMRRAEPNKWAKFFLNNTDREGKNALECLRGIIGTYRTLYNINEIEWYEDHLTSQLKSAYNDLLKPDANAKHTLVALLLDVWPAVVQQKSTEQKISPKPAPVTVSKALERASEEQTASEHKPEPEQPKRKVRTTHVAAVREA